jgi:arylsulfatase A-like enzyme
MRGPGIPEGTVCGELTGTIDVLPTIAAITGRPLPAGRKIDGMDVSGLWTGRVEKSPRQEFVHYTSRGDLEGMRQGNWKLLVKKPRVPRNRKKPATPKPPQVLLFDLSKDVGERNNVAEANPKIVTRLQTRMDELDAEITKNARAPWTKQ